MDTSPPLPSVAFSNHRTDVSFLLPVGPGGNRSFRGSSADDSIAPNICSSVLDDDFHLSRRAIRKNRTSKIGRTLIGSSFLSSLIRASRDA